MTEMPPIVARRETKAKNAAIFAPALVLMLAPSLACASEGGAHHGASPLALIPYWVNFLLYLGLLYFFLRKEIPRMWAERREGIDRAVKGAAAELEKAVTALETAHERFDNVEEEVRRIKEQIRKDTLIERDAILEDAKRQCERAFQRAHETAASERARAELGVRRELAEHVLANAARRLKERVTPESDRPRRDKVMDGFKQMLNL